MHIILGVITALGALAFWLYRAREAAHAAHELGDMAGNVRGMFRRWRWRKRTELDLSRQVDDPSLAAAVMMCAMAQSDALLTERERDVMLDQMQRNMGLDETQAEELFARARWLTSDMKDLDATLRRVSRPVIENCTAAEKTDLLAMLVVVAETEGPADNLQQAAIERLRRELFATG